MPQTQLYPLRFSPILRRYLWGGRRLGTALGKPIGDESDYAESWEVVDHGDDQSRVAFGPLKGIELRQVVAEYGPALFGRHAPQSRFPLLFKFLDCNRHLSVQVHPNDAQAAQLDPPDLGKTEAWIILDAEPGAELFAGLKRGFDRPALAREIDRSTTQLCLHRVEPKPGDCLFIPAGVVHALGAGLLVAEIQQASDTTYRLFDWNRVGADGKSRPLHIEPALEVIDFERGPVDPQPVESTGEPGVERLVACDKFVADRIAFDSPRILGGDDRFHILAVIGGAIRVEGEPSGETLGVGQTVLLPASTAAEVAPELKAVVLDMYLP